jgi:phospholipid/cholesterol/gamma-HCH transport system permease protein
MSVELRRSAEAIDVELTGEWVAGRFGALERELRAIDLSGLRQLSIATRAVTALDLTGAWILNEFLHRARASGASVSFRDAPPDQLRLLDETLKPEAQPGSAGAEAAPAAPAAPARPAAETLATIGRTAVDAGRDLSGGLAFLGRVSATLLAALVRPRRLRPISVARHVYESGITAMPIVALIAFLISVIIAYMSAKQLRGLGASIYVVDLVTIGVLRELGVLLTAIIVAGRSGSAFAAELGSMRLNEEVDALESTGVDPFELLVVPRVVGLTIALPLLTVIADLIGLTGGALLCRYLLDMPLSQYAHRVTEAISPSTFWVGMVKAPVFALLIALAGCYRGLEVRGSARELGRLVTVAVVQAIFTVILADALFAVLFMEIDV